MTRARKMTLYSRIGDAHLNPSLKIATLIVTSFQLTFLTVRGPHPLLFLRSFLLAPSRDQVLFSCTKEMEKAFLKAAFVGDLPRVKDLISQGCPVNAQTKAGHNALHMAALGGHVSSIQYLAQKMQSLLHDTENLGFTLLHCAAQEGHAELVQLLIDDYNLNPTARTKDGSTPVMVAAGKGHTGVVDLLVHKYNCSLTEVNKDGDNALHRAALGGHVSTIQYLAPKMQSLLHDTENLGFTLLHCAALEGHAEVVQLLIDEYKLNPTARTEDGLTPVALASRNGHSDLVDILVKQYGCSISDVEKGLEHAFLSAALKGDLPKMKDLLDQGCPVHAQNNAGQNALHTAALGGHVSTIQYLAPKMGSLLHDTENLGFTLLHCAAQEGHAELVQLLIDEYKLNPTARTESGMTPVMLAAGKGHTGVVDLLVHKYNCSLAEVNRGTMNALHLAADGGRVSTIKYLAPLMESLLHNTTNTGSSMLHLAAEAGHAEVVQLVVDDYKLNPTASDKQGNTPLQIALNNNHLDVARILLQKGALAGVKDSDAVVEAVMQGDVDTAKRLLRVAESEPQKPPSWFSAYEEAVEKGGSVEVDINRCILIGPSGTGKSCFKHLLVHNKPKEVKISTPVMEKPDVVTISAEEYAVEGHSIWVPFTDEKMANSIRSSCQNREYDVDGDTVDMIPEEYPEEQVSEFTPPVEEINLPTVAAKMFSSSSRAEPNPPKSAPLIPTQPSPFYEAHSRLMNDPTPGDTVLLNGGRFVHLLDTGGQPSFQAVLPLLLDVPCTSLFIFNASRGLDENVPVTYRPDEATMVEAESSCEKAWTMMLRSLSSVYNLAHKVSSNAQALLVAKRLPPFRAVVVGTFKDCLIEKGNIASATQEIAEHMQQLEKKPYYSQIIPDSEGQLFHLVTNFPRYEASGHTLENQASVNSLREILSHPDGALNAKIPIGWYHFEIVCRKVDQKFFTFSDLLQHARELKCVTSADQFRSLLQLFHALGVFTFIDREDVSHMVCTDSSAFMQVVSKLLAVEFLTAPKCPAVKMFKKKGILSLDRGLFNELGISKEVDPEWLLRCLCHLGVAACLSPAGTDTPEYFIPAALPPESKAVVCGSVAPLLVAFKFKANAFLTKEDFPHGIFARLAVELANNGWEVITEKNTRLSIQFHWKELDISIIESAGFIRIVPIVSIHAKCNAVKLHECCSAVQSTFKAAIHASAQAVLGSKFTDKADTVIGFACPCKARPTHLAVARGDSIVCTLPSAERQEYSKSHQVWFSHVEGAQLQAHSSNPSMLCFDDPTSRGGGESATPFPVTEILEKHETEFFSVVNARLSLLRLKRLQVITQDIMVLINAATNDEDAQEILYEHLTDHANMDSLLKYCEVIIAAGGYPRMQSLGMKMKEDLQCMQGVFKEVDSILPPAYNDDPPSPPPAATAVDDDLPPLPKRPCMR